MGSFVWDNKDIEVLKYESDHWISFKTTCQCQHGSITVDCYKWNDDDQLIEYELYFQTTWTEDYKMPWYSRLWMRIKAACKLIWSGYLDTDSGFVFRDSKHFDQFITALKATNEKAKEWKMKQNN